MAGTEGAEYVKDLNQNAPGGSDLVSDGDDHLRMIKKSLLQSFPSDIEVQIPNIVGHAGASLVVNSGADGVQWGETFGRNLVRPVFTSSGRSLTIGPGMYSMKDLHSHTLWEDDRTIEAPDNTATGTRWIYVYLRPEEEDGHLHYLSDILPQPEGHAWWSGEDRCIFAVRQELGNNIIPFEHEGGDLVMYEHQQNMGVISGPSTSWQDLNVKLPRFTRRAQAVFHAVGSGSVSEQWYRIPGKPGHHLVTSVGTGQQVNTMIIYSGEDLTQDSGDEHKLEVITNGADSLTCYTSGFFLPEGL